MRVENSFVAVDGVGEVTERRLWADGVTHWDAFDGSVVGPTRAERIAAYIDEARDRLAANDAVFFGRTLPARSHWRLYENFREEACFFDIETTGLDRRHARVTTACFHRGGETTALVRGRDLTREAVARELRGASLLVSFNGKRFDVPFLEREFDLGLDAPHLDLRDLCRRIDLDGGLKRVERAVGLERDRPDLSGRDAVRLWRRYERGDEDALDTLVAYNREDAENLRPILDRVADRLHRDVFERACREGPE